MADRANDEILQLAEQGNLQALSVYLNRHLIPNGAHVKVKQKEDSLHVLIVVMRESEYKDLLCNVQQLLTSLHPDPIKRVRLYTQVLGQKQSTLRQQFSISASIPQAKVKESGAADKIIPPQTVTAPPQASRNGQYSSTVSKQAQAKPPNVQPVSSRPSASSKKSRYSVAEFLSQATSLDELKVLHNHPFFTGVCPQCHALFPGIDSPPIYWDCPQCGWQDDLSTVLPQDKIRAASAQPSLTESKRLGDYLVEAGLLTNGQIEVALKDQLATNLRFGEVLVRRGWIKEETIEYLMQKVILPERTGFHQNAASYLESSRNLLKALFQDIQFETTAPALPAPVLQAPPVSTTVPPQPFSTAAAPRPPRVMPSAGKLANERETLILPDLDISDYLKDA